MDGELGMYGADARDGEAAYRWSIHGQWPAILAGSLAGLGATLVMTTLGAAIGISAGALTAAHGTAARADEVATGLGLGVIVWVVLTAAVAGFVGGEVLGLFARRDRPFHPALFGLLTWAGGVLLALVVASTSTTGLMAGAGSASALAASRMQPSSAFDAARAPSSAATAPNSTMTESEMRAAAEAAAKAAAAAAWVALIGQLIGLGVTMLAARRGGPAKAAPRERPLQPTPARI